MGRNLTPPPGPHIADVTARLAAMRADLTEFGRCDRVAVDEHLATLLNLASAAVEALHDRAAVNAARVGEPPTDPTPTASPWLTRTQAAALLGLHVKGLDYLRGQGDLTDHHTGQGRTGLRFAREEVLALKHNRENPTPTT